MTEQKMLTEEEIKARQDYCDEIRPVVFDGGEKSLLSICDSLFLHIRALAAERDRLAEQQRWIPVEERLPGTTGRYLVYDEGALKNDKVASRYFYRLTDEEFANEKRYNENTEQAYFAGKKVTHWAPLPLPPQPSEKGQQ